MNSPARSIVIPRIKAFAIDYLLILVYVGFLFGATMLVSKLFDIRLDRLNTITAEIIGFFTLTLPVILYFTVTEAGSFGGSVGKRKLGLKVVSVKLSRPGFLQLLARNFVKFLPWEMAHFFVYQLVERSRSGIQPPGWIMAGLIGSQAMAIIYFLFIVFNKNNRSIYEIASGTRVVNDSTI